MQGAIGVPVNFTQDKNPVPSAFQHTGDMERADPIREIAYLLSIGVRVGLVYGDRDYLWYVQSSNEISTHSATILDLLIEHY